MEGYKSEKEITVRIKIVDYPLSLAILCLCLGLGYCQRVDQTESPDKPKVIDVLRKDKDGRP